MTYDYAAYLDLPTVRGSKGGPVGPQVPAHLLADFSEDAHQCEAIHLARQVCSEHTQWLESLERQEQDRRGRQEAVRAAKAGGGGYPGAGAARAGAVAAPRRPPVWEFSLSSGGWEAFKPEHQPQLEGAHARFLGGSKGDTETAIKHGAHTIVVNFASMTQQVRGSDRKRNVRRRE
ncbi:unnamed protein product [Prorocentrum cordatum]|uniref:WWE domain-containing protein n=1 Tax=Prorocentrum cordatum TaxID=2364126 RepID=A0ABN9VPY8_9DINO|nr:unnamed protein product [Polarella glacialis]